jgi:phosphoribosylformylglycinamidine synthase
MKKGQVLRIPIAHNEGRFYTSKREQRELADGGQVVFRYCDERGRPTPSANPTGTLDGIAGVCNRAGNVVGLMPHPERATEPILSPFGSADGSLIFKSMLESI